MKRADKSSRKAIGATPVAADPPPLPPLPEPPKPLLATFADVNVGDKLHWWDMTVRVTGKDESRVTISDETTGRSKSLYSGEFDAQGLEKVLEEAKP